MSKTLRKNLGKNPGRRYLWVITNQQHVSLHRRLFNLPVCQYELPWVLLNNPSMRAVAIRNRGIRGDYFRTLQKGVTYPYVIWVGAICDIIQLQVGTLPGYALQSFPTLAPSTSTPSHTNSPFTADPAGSCHRSSRHPHRHQADTPHSDSSPATAQYPSASQCDGS